MEMIEVFYKILTDLYNVFTRYESVYLFYLVPVTYFMAIVVRLVYYKLKYHGRLASRDFMAVATMLLIGLDYVNYLYLLISGTGKLLPLRELIIKYTIGFLLWAWMFWYSYKVHLKRSLTKENLRKQRVVIVCVFSMFIILVIIGMVVS